MFTNNYNDDENRMRQDDELMALKEIYGESIIETVSERNGGNSQRIIRLSVSPIMGDQSLQFTHFDDDGNEVSVSITHLPQSTLEVTLLPIYPGDCDSPPGMINK